MSDEYINDVNPADPSQGKVLWRQITLEVTTSHTRATHKMKKSGIWLGHGSNAMSVASISESGCLFASHDIQRHEFGVPGVYGSKISAPASPNFKDAPFRYGTVSCIFPQNAPHWDLRDNWIDMVNDEMRIPLTKFVWICEITEEGMEHRTQSNSQNDPDWAWSFAHENDLHLSKLCVLIGLPPQCENFRYSGFWIDPTNFTYLEPMQPMVRSDSGSLT